MKYSMSIAMVAILLAASFVGIACFGDDSDAAVTSNISIGTEVGDFAENSITYVDGKISGILKEGILIPAVAAEGDTPATPAVKGYKFTMIFSGLSEGQKVYYMYKDSEVAASEAVPDTTGKAKIMLSGNVDSIKEKTTDFKFIVTSATVGTPALFNEMYASIGQDLTFDLRYSGEIIEIRYAVGELVYVKEAMKNQPYTLITLEDLNAPTPSGYKFAGWSYKLDGKENQALAGSAVSFGDDIILTAVFEALPEAVITFVDGTSTLKSINVSDLSEKTVPSVEKTGYTFDGWFMGDVKVDPLTYTFEESVTLVAQWTPINCYVTFVAGDFVKTVPVLYGDRVQAPALPDGFEKWNFDFSVVITDDLTITAVEKAPEKPTGLADPTVKMALVIVGLFVCVLLAVIILKREDIRAGMVRKLSKAEDVKEDKKE